MSQRTASIDPSVKADKRGKMSALIPELVNIASDPTVSTADLLRRSLVAARRLDVQEFVEWINSEMNGYGQEVTPPRYRFIHGEVMAYNPVRGHDIPFIISNAKAAAALSFHVERQSIAVLEQLLVPDKQIMRYFPTAVEQQLLEDMYVKFRPKLVFSKAQVQGIVEMARNKILEWALDLEARGIIGEGLSFTPEEKQAVQHHFHISNVTGSQIQISSSGSTQTQANQEGADLDALKGLIENLSAALESAHGEVADELRSELATLKAQAESPKPKWAIIKATARSIKTIAEGAAGNVLGGLAQPYAATLLALAS